jgi:hypothetical protein
MNFIDYLSSTPGGVVMYLQNRMQGSGYRIQVARFTIQDSGFRI